MRLQLRAYDGAAYVDWSASAGGLRASWAEHGSERLSGFVRASYAESSRWMQRALEAPDVQLCAGPLIIWRGRLEDVRPTADGFDFQALGLWRFFTDLPFVGMFSTRDYGRFRPVTDDDLSGRTPEKFQLDNNNRIYVAPRKGETFDSSDVGSLTIETPDGSDLLISRVTFDYEFYGGTDWDMLINRMGRDFSSVSQEWKIDGNNALQTGSVTLSLATPAARIELALYRATSPATELVIDTGILYAKWTNLRVMTSDQATITGDEVVEQLIIHVNTVNVSRLDTSTALLTSPGVDLDELVMEDAYLADVLDQVAVDTDGKRMEVGVGTDRIVYLRSQGSESRTWLIDLDDSAIEQTLEALANSAYAVYTDEAGETRRTAVSTDADSVARYGLTRRVAVQADTTSATRAGYIRDRALRPEPEPRAGLDVVGVYATNQAPVPLHVIRPSDVLIPRTLPPLLPPALVDYLSEFVVKRVEYNADRHVLRVEPADPLPTVEQQTANIEQSVRQR